MPDDPYPTRRSPRIFRYDYRTAGAYMVTICSARRREIFGHVASDRVDLNWIGQIVAEELRRIPTIRSDVTMDAFVVMPNHLHAIVSLQSDQGISLLALMNQFKAAVTRRVRATTVDTVEIWQRGFYERIIQNDRQLGIAREYIEDNPRRWAEDRENVRCRSR